MSRRIPKPGGHPAARYALAQAQAGSSCWLGLLVLGVTLGTTGCRRKAPREHALGDDPRIEQYQNPTGSRHLDRIVLLRGFDRKEVPNLTLHVLEASTLKVLKRVKLALDTQVGLAQIGQCRYFKARAPNTKPRVYELDDDFQLNHVSAGSVPAACWGTPRLELTDGGRRRWLVIRAGLSSRTLPLPNPPGLHPSVHSVARAVVLNRGRSVLVLDQFGGGFAIPDVQKPRLQRLDVKQAGFRPPVLFLLAANIQSRAAFVAAWQSQPNAKEHTILYRLDPFGGRHARLADVGIGAPEQLLHLARERVLLYRNNRETALLVVDDRTGQIRHQVKLAPGDRSRRVLHTARVNDRTYALAGRELIDIGHGRVVAELPDRIGKSVLSADHKHIYYNARAPWTPTHLTIRRFDLAQRRVVSSRKLKDVGHGHRHTSAEMKQLFLLPGGRLLAVGGGAGAYMNHRHR